MRFLNKVVVVSLVILVTSASGSSVSICDPRQILSKPAWEGTNQTTFGLLPQEIEVPLVTHTSGPALYGHMQLNPRIFAPFYEPPVLFSMNVRNWKQ